MYNVGISSSAANTRMTYIEYFFLITAFLYPFLTIFQGLDFTDMGFSIFRYHNFFSTDFSLPSFATFFTDFTGSVWGKISPVNGVFSYKLFFALITLATQITVWFSLRKEIPRKTLLSGICLATLVITPELQWFNYNNLSALLYVCSGLFLIHATKKNRCHAFFIASFFLVLTTFARIPNILGFLLLLIPFTINLNTKDLKTVTRPLFAVITGILCGVSFILLAFIISGKQAVIKEAFLGLINSAGYSESKYNLLQLLFRQITDYGKTVLAITAIFLSFYISYKSGRKISSNKKRKFLLPAIGAAIFLLIFYLPMWLIEQRINKLIVNYPIFIVALLLLIILPFIFRNRNKWREYGALYIALGIMVLISQGSVRGLKNAIYGMWLLIPIALHIFSRNKSFSRFPDTQNVSMARTGILMVALFFTLTHALTMIYRDSTCRSKMRFGLDHPRLKAIYTTKERAASVNSLTKELDRRKIQGKILLSYECLPLVHYLYDTKPYLQRPWVMLMSAEKITVHLSRAVKQNAKLPIILRAKFQARKWSWPIPPAGLKARYKRTHNRKRRIILDRFLEIKKYKKVWDNGYFEIFSPNR